MDRLAQAYWDFFTWFETSYPEAHVAYIHFPTKLDGRPEFKKRGDAIREIMAAIATTKPYILNIDVDDSLVDGYKDDPFPYHFSQSTAKALADRWIRLEDNRSGLLQGRAEKIACVVQGDIRRGTVEVLNPVARHFDVVILSTWKSDEQKVPPGNFKLILNDKPLHYGATNRNMQRRTASAGITLAESLGCTHVMKLRTDMLPTRLDMQKMLTWTHFNVPDGIPSRIVTCAFRNISVEPDWFSEASRSVLVRFRRDDEASVGRFRIRLFARDERSPANDRTLRPRMGKRTECVRDFLCRKRAVCDF